MINVFKTTPYQHQKTVFDVSKNADYFALFMEQRTGKTKVTLDTVAHQYTEGKIDALLIVAPAGVHRNWVTDEIPTHLHDSTQYQCILWRSGRMVTKEKIRDLDALLKHKGLAILSVNVDALTTPVLQKYLAKFLTKRKVFAAIDESVDISSPSAKRTRVALRIGKRAVTRRILDGTPVDASPFGLYSQATFLQPGLLGTSFTTFKSRYGRFKARDVGERDRVCPDCIGNGFSADGERCERCRGACFIGNRTFPELVEYQNLEELKSRIDRFSYRVRRDQCADLPPKIYEKKYFELSVTQRRAYNELREEFQTELRGQTVTASIMLARYIRLQQISSNHVGINAQLALCGACAGQGCAACDEQGYVGNPGKILTVDTEHHSRLEALQEVLRNLEGQGIIWCRFRYDVDSICQKLNDVVRYDGAVGDDERAVALQQFQSGARRLFVANPRAAGRGLDLANANFTLYFSHDWSLRWRRQSEDRAQSLKKRDSVLYVDLVAENTIDELIIKALRAGKEISDMMLGDPHGQWI